MASFAWLSACSLLSNLAVGCLSLIFSILMFIIGFIVCLFSGPLDFSVSAALESGLEIIFEDDMEDCGVFARF